METHGWLSVLGCDRLRTETKYEELSGTVKWARLQGRAFEFCTFWQRVSRGRP